MSDVVDTLRGHFEAQGYPHLRDAADEIKRLRAGFAAALRWLDSDVSHDVRAATFDMGEAKRAGYSGEYLNDLADMRAAATHLPSANKTPEQQ